MSDRSLSVCRNYAIISGLPLPAPLTFNDRRTILQPPRVNHPCIPPKEKAMSTAPKPQTVQDPVKLDPKHYNVEIENEQVRVLHVNYGAREKSVMHSHPDGVAVF